MCSGKRLVVGELGGHHEPTHLQECKFDFQNQKGGNQLAGELKHRKSKVLGSKGNYIIILYDLI